MRKLTIGPFLYVLFIALLGDCLGVGGKLAVALFPWFDVFMRRVVFTLICAIILRWTYFKKNSMGKESFWWIGVLAAANTILYTYGIQFTTASVGQLIYLTVPLWTLALSPFFLGRRSLSKQQYVGVILSIGGALLFFNEKIGQVAETSLYGNVVVMAACICYAGYGIASKYYQKTYSSQERVLSYAMVSVMIGGVAIPKIGLENIFREPYIVLGIVLFLGIFSLVSNLTTQKAIEKHGAFIASAVFYIQPFMGVLLAYFILGEQVGLVQLMGGVAALGGAYLITRTSYT